MRYVDGVLDKDYRPQPVGIIYEPGVMDGGTAIYDVGGEVLLGGNIMPNIKTFVIEVDNTNESRPFFLSESRFAHYRGTVILQIYLEEPFYRVLYNSLGQTRVLTTGKFKFQVNDAKLVRKRLYLATSDGVFVDDKEKRRHLKGTNFSLIAVSDNPDSANPFRTVLYTPDAQQLIVINRTGKRRKIEYKSGEIKQMSISADGSLLAVLTSDGVSHIYKLTDDIMERLFAFQQSGFDVKFLKFIGGRRIAVSDGRGIVIFTTTRAVLHKKLVTNLGQLRDASKPLIRFYRNLVKGLPLVIKLQLINEFATFATFRSLKKETSRVVTSRVLPVSNECMLIAALGFFLDEWFTSRSDTFPENIFFIAKRAYPDITHDGFVQLMKDLAEYSCDEEFQRAVDFDMSSIAATAGKTREKFREQEMEKSKQQERELLEQERARQLREDRELAERIARQWN
jgi:hypothetical protein